MMAIPLTVRVGQWHMLSSLESITQQGTLILTMTNTGPSDRQVGQWESCSQAQRLTISLFCSAGWSGLASATPLPQASGSLKSFSDSPLSLASKINPGSIEDTYVPGSLRGISCSSLSCQQLRSSPLPNRSPHLFWDMEGCGLGMWILELLDGDCILWLWHLLGAFTATCPSFLFLKYTTYKGLCIVLGKKPSYFLPSPVYYLTSGWFKLQFCSFLSSSHLAKTEF